MITDQIRLLDII